MFLQWINSSTLDSQSYICGHCNHPLASNQGYAANDLQSPFVRGYIYICHHCQCPTFFIKERGSQVAQAPSPAFGDSIKHLPTGIDSLYNEARNCLKENASTASILCSRKLLMNIAVSKGAGEGQNFIDYVNYLSDKGYVPPDGKEWVDHIRSKGNEATHEIKIMSRADAEELITFLEMLLKFIYEFPAHMKSKTRKP